MQARVIPTGDYSANCTVVWNEPDKAFVIDPGADGGDLLEFLRENGLTPSAYLLTHGHLDHLSALPEMLASMPAPVYMNKKDALWAFTKINFIPGYVQPEQKPEILVDDIIDGSIIEAGSLKAKVITTPGHTPGGVCYFFEEESLLVAGDTLFNGSVGRTDLPGGDWGLLASSLSKLMELNDDVVVVCGHGQNTTIGAERRDNPYINQ